MTYCLLTFIISIMIISYSYVNIIIIIILLIQIYFWIRLNGACPTNIVDYLKLLRSRFLIIISTYLFQFPRGPSSLKVPFLFRKNGKFLPPGNFIRRDYELCDVAQNFAIFPPDYFSLKSFVNNSASIFASQTEKREKNDRAINIHRHLLDKQKIWVVRFSSILVKKLKCATQLNWHIDNAHINIWFDINMHYKSNKKKNSIPLIV